MRHMRQCDRENGSVAEQKPGRHDGKDTATGPAANAGGHASAGDVLCASRSRPGRPRARAETKRPDQADYLNSRNSISSINIIPIAVKHIMIKIKTSIGCNVSDVLSSWVAMSAYDLATNVPAIMS